MPRLAGLSIFTWCLLLAAPLPLAIAAAIRRTQRVFVVMSFSVAAVVTGVLGSWYTVYVAERYDAKFAGAPIDALELALVFDAVIAIIGTVLFGGVLLFVRNPGRAYIAAIAGCVYILVPQLLHLFEVDVGWILLWIWLLGVPLASALLIVIGRKKMHTQSG